MDSCRTLIRYPGILYVANGLFILGFHITILRSLVIWSQLPSSNRQELKLYELHEYRDYIVNVAYCAIKSSQTLLEYWVGPMKPMGLGWPIVLMTIGYPSSVYAEIYHVEIVTFFDFFCILIWSLSFNEIVTFSLCLDVMLSPITHFLDLSIFSGFFSLSAWFICHETKLW